MKNYTGLITRDDEMNPQSKASFENGYQTFLLPAGTVLWRFVSEDRFNQRFGPFWMSADTMTTMMTSLHMTGDFSARNKKETIKNGLAILTGWSNPGWRLKISLQREVVAYVGKTRAQKQFINADFESAFGGGPVQQAIEHRLGGYEQYVIPRFRNLPNVNLHASVEHFAHI